MTDLPLISCLCVTRGRYEFLQNAKNKFLAQTYPNTELVIVCEDWVAAHFEPPGARIIEVGLGNMDGPHISIGKQRNRCLEVCRGEYIAVWDDDDPHPPTRLQFQYDALQKARKQRPKSPPRAIAQARETIYDSTTGEVWISYRRLWENSFLCLREDLVSIGGYPDKQVEEDTEMIQNFKRKFGGTSIELNGDYRQYIYVRHTGSTTNTEAACVGRNLWGIILSSSFHADEAYAKTIRDIMKEQP